MNIHARHKKTDIEGGIYRVSDAEEGRRLAKELEESGVAPERIELITPDSTKDYKADMRPEALKEPGSLSDAPEGSFNMGSVIVLCVALTCAALIMAGTGNGWLALGAGALVAVTGYGLLYTGRGMPEHRGANIYKRRGASGIYVAVKER